MRKIFVFLVIIGITTSFTLAKPDALNEIGVKKTVNLRQPVNDKPVVSVRQPDFQRINLDSKVKRISSGSSRLCTGSPAYVNTQAGSGYYTGGFAAGDTYGDDIQVAVPGGGDLVCLELGINVDSATATLPFDFTVSIYNDCPDTGTVILGSTHTWTVNDIDFVLLEHTYATPIAIPENIYVVVTSTSDGVDWLLTDNLAQLGYTSEYFAYDDPGTGWGCNWWFGAGFWTSFYCALYMDIDETPFVTCPGGGIPENEPPCGDDYVDTYNGGCNSTPEIFQAINCGDTICGQTGNYIVGGTEAHRDTDWFEFTLTNYRDVTFEVVGEAPLRAILIDPVDCSNYTIIDSDSVPFGTTITLSAYLGPGTYWAVVLPIVFEGYPCEVPYLATLTCTVPPLPPVNDLCENAEEILAPYPKTVTGTTLGATIDCPGDLDFNAVWYEFDAPYAMNKISIDFCPTTGASNSASLVLFDEAASPGCPSDCSAYIVADAYGFLECPSTEVNPSIVWYLPAGTYLYPAITDPQMDFSFTLDITDISGMTVEQCDPAAYFNQPFVGDTVYTVSDLNPGYISADDFSGVTTPIEAVTWWGIEIGPRTDLNYVITFYDDNAGFPGTVISQQTELATRVTTIYYPFGNMEYGSVYRYTAELTTPVTLASGWVSVAAVDSGADWFYWADGGDSTGSSDYVQDTGAGWAVSGYDMNLAVCLEPAPVPPPLPAAGPIGFGLLLAAIGGLLIRRRK